MPMKPESNEFFHAVERITRGLYTIGEGVTRLPPLPKTPMDIQREMMARAGRKRLDKRSKRLDNWRGAI